MKRLKLTALSSDSLVKEKPLKRTVYCSRGRNYVRRRSHLSNKSQYMWREKSVSLDTLRKEQAAEFSKDESKHAEIILGYKKKQFSMFELGFKSFLVLSDGLFKGMIKEVKEA